MNVTLSLQDDLVRRVRKIAVDQDTTLTGLVRAYLERLVVEEAAKGRKRLEQDALALTFDRIQFKAGKRAWKREELHARH